MIALRAISVVVVVFVLGAVPGTGSTQTLEEELGVLLVDNPQILSAEKTIESTNKEIDKALAGYMPTLQVTAEFGPEWVDSPAERSRRSGHISARSRRISTLTLTQNLFNGFVTASNTKTARLNALIASFTAEGTRQNTLFEGVNAYVNVLRQKRLIELAQANEDTIQIQLNLEDERVQRGSGIAVDVLQAKSRLQIAKERRVNFEGGLEDAVSTYAQVFGHAPDIDELLDPVPPVERLPTEIGAAIELGLRENPAVGNSDATIEVTRERRRAIRAEYLPTFDMVGTANNENNNNAAIGTRRDYSIILQATWDLFTGFSTQASMAQASMAQAAFDYGASKDNYAFVVRKVVEQVRLSWQALLTVRERLELLENAINIASEGFDSRQKLREAGKETVINVLDAESEIFNAQINFTAAAYDERIAVYQLLLAMGRLNAQNLELAAVE